MNTTREIDLPFSGKYGLCHAGEGSRLDQGKSSFVVWYQALWDWLITIPRIPGREYRLWCALIKRSGLRKIERTLPSGRRIRIFESGLANFFPDLKTKRIDGPWFYLSFRDAEALWKDKDVTIKPVCDKIIIGVA